MNKSFYKTLLAAGCLALTQCAGPIPAPIATVQINDEYMVCEQIYQEMKDNQREIAELIPRVDKRAKNVTYAIGGVFLLFPWLMMDFTQTERKEIHAFILRNQHLRDLARGKSCDMASLPRPMRLPQMTLPAPEPLHRTI